MPRGTKKTGKCPTCGKPWAGAPKAKPAKGEGSGGAIKGFGGKGRPAGKGGGAGKGRGMGKGYATGNQSR